MQLHDMIRRQLCNGLQEESGSGLICAKTPALSRLSGWEQEEEEEDDSSGVGTSPGPNSICK